MKYGYAPIFAVCSMMYLLALGCVHLLIGELGVICPVAPGDFVISIEKKALKL